MEAGSNFRYVERALYRWSLVPRGPNSGADGKFDDGSFDGGFDGADGFDGFDGGFKGFGGGFDGLDGSAGGVAGVAETEGSSERVNGLAHSDELTLKIDGALTVAMMMASMVASMALLVGLVCFDGYDGGVIGSAEAHDRAKKWCRTSFFSHKICEERADGLTRKICEERVDELTIKIDGERVGRLTHIIREERVDGLIIF